MGAFQSLDSLFSEENNGTKNHARDRNKDSKDSRKRKKTLVRDNEPNDWKAPM